MFDGGGNMDPAHYHVFVFHLVSSCYSEKFST